MSFVRLDANGKVEAIFRKKVDEDLVEVENNDPILDQFLRDQQITAAINVSFIESDLSIVRVLEDLIDVLIEKGVFRFTDLPEMAQNKLLKRRGLRKEFAYMATLFTNEENDDGDLISINMDGEADSEGLL